MKRLSAVTAAVTTAVCAAVCALVFWTAAGCRTLAPGLPKIPFPAQSAEGPQPLLSLAGEPLDLRFAPNGQYMAALYTPETVEERRLPTARPVSGRIALFNTEFKTPFPIEEKGVDAVESPRSFAFTRTGDALWIAAETGTDQANLFNIPFLERKKEGKPLFDRSRPYRHFLLSPHGGWFAGMTAAGDWEIVDTAEPQRTVVFPPAAEVPELKAGTVVRIIDFSPDDELVATLMVGPDRTDSKVKTVAIWDLKVARSIPLADAKTLPLRALYVASFEIKEQSPEPLGTFSPDGQMIAFRTKSRYVGVWQTASGRLLAEFGEHRQAVTALEFSPSSNQLAVGLENSRGRIVLWDVRKGTLLRARENPTKDEGSVLTMAFDPEGRIVRYGNSDGEIGEWDIHQNVEKQKK